MINEMGLKNQLVSVIVPVYNMENYLERCLSSICESSYRNLEIICVNDGSKDRSIDILNRYMESDERVHVITVPNGGLSSARNIGMEAATGSYLAFVDSDDTIRPDMISTMVQSMEAAGTEVGIVCCDYCSVDENDEIIKEHIIELKQEIIDAEDAIDLFSEYYGLYGTAWNKLYRKTLFDTIRFPEGRIFEDVSIMPKLFLRAGKVLNIPESFYCYRQRQGSIMKSPAGIKDLDLGYALIENYRFAREYGFDKLKNKAAYRLSYAIERWNADKRPDRKYLEKLKEVKMLSAFLLFEKYAWKDYSFLGKVRNRLRILL